MLIDTLPAHVLLYRRGVDASPFSAANCPRSSACAPVGLFVSRETIPTLPALALNRRISASKYSIKICHFTGAESTRSGGVSAFDTRSSSLEHEKISTTSARGRLTKLKTLGKNAALLVCQAIWAGRHKETGWIALRGSTLFSSQNSPKVAAPLTSGIPTPAHASILVQWIVVSVAFFKD